MSESPQDRLAGHLHRCRLHIRDLRNILESFESSVGAGVNASDARGALLTMTGRLLADSAVLDELRRRP